MSGANIQSYYDRYAEAERKKLTLLDAKSAAKKKQALSNREKIGNSTQGLIPSNKSRSHNTLPNL